MCLWGVVRGEMPSLSKLASDSCSLASLALPSGGRTSALGDLSVLSCVSVFAGSGLGQRLCVLQLGGAHLETRGVP